MKSEPVTAIEHYETFLAQHYTWMSGSFADKVIHQHDLLTRSGVVPTTSATAVDLACGPGAQSIALAQLGFSVIAIDANRKLLEELRLHAGNLPIRPVLHDLCELSSCSALPTRIDLAVCVGDIIPHLPSRQCVTSVFQKLSELLVANGRLILGFRDLSEERFGVNRFIPIRSDPERIMTCFLEFEQETVIVHDLLYVRQDESWELHKSAYRKLRLSLTWVCSQLEEQGFAIQTREQSGGVWNVVASKL
jgi:SAM-dependent methyltransferase